MFNKIKRYLTQQPVNDTKQPEQTKIMASVCFILKKNDKSTTIDISIDDFDDDSLIALAHIINTIYSENAQIETMNIIGNSFKNNKQDAALIKLLSMVDNIKTLYSGKSNDGPCIKPSDML